MRTLRDCSVAVLLVLLLMLSGCGVILDSYRAMIHDYDPIYEDKKE